MVAAAKVFCVPFAFYYERAAMRADVRQTMRLYLFVYGQQKRLVEAAFQQGERAHMSWRFHARRLADELPRPGEDPLPRTLVPRRIAIHLARKCLRPGDLVCDFEVLLHFGRSD